MGFFADLWFDSGFLCSGLFRLGKVCGALPTMSTWAQCYKRLFPCKYRSCNAINKFYLYLQEEFTGKIYRRISPVITGVFPWNEISLITDMYICGNWVLMCNVLLLGEIFDPRKHILAKRIKFTKMEMLFHFDHPWPVL